VRRKVAIAVTMAVAMVLTVVGFRSRGSSHGSVYGGGWFDRTVGARFIDARETLRDTRTFGALINELFPQEAVAGEMVALPPPPAAP
jgi:hypothetical protein